MEEINSNNTQLMMLNKTLEMATEAIFIMNKKGRVVFANSAACKHLSYTKDEVLELYVWDIDYDVNTKEKYFDAITNFNRNAEHVDIESFHINKNQEIIPVKISSTIIDVNDDSFVISYVSDITRDKEKDKRIELYFELIKESNEIIFFVDTKTELIEFANNKACKTLGYSLMELKKMKISKIRKPLNDDLEIPEVFKKAKKQKELTTFGKYLCKDGNFVFVETSLRIKEYEGKEYIIAISRDISERLELERNRDELNKKLENYNTKLKDEVNKIKEELYEYEDLMHKQSRMAAMGETLQNIAHQWRQPLSVVSVLATGIKLQVQTNSLDEKFLIDSLEDMHKSIDYLSQTIEDFSNYFKPNYEKTIFSSQELIEYTISLAKARFDDIEFIVNIENISIYNYKNELVQIIINILNNAVDELIKKEKKRYVFIDIFIIDKKINFKIKDNAGGIPEEIINKVFEPYFTTKHKSQGTGIGLYMSSELVRKHMNGEISVCNKNYSYKNKNYMGAEFLISIPNKRA